MNMDDGNEELLALSLLVTITEQYCKGTKRNN